MTASRRTTIKADSDGESTLASTSAADFLELLGKKQINLAHVVTPEKKKYELHVEPEFHRDTPVLDFINIITEKKKVEYELPPGSFDGSRIQPEQRPWYNHGGSSAYPNPEGSDPPKRWPFPGPNPEWVKVATPALDAVIRERFADPHFIDKVVQDIGARIDARVSAELSGRASR